MTSSSSFCPVFLRSRLKCMPRFRSCLVLTSPLPGLGEDLFVPARVVFGIDVVELQGRTSVDLHHDLAAGHRVVVHVRIEKGKTAGGEGGHLVLIEDISHSNFEGSGDDGDVFPQGMPSAVRSGIRRASSDARCSHRWRHSDRLRARRIVRPGARNGGAGPHGMVSGVNACFS